MCPNFLQHRLCIAKQSVAPFPRYLNEDRLLPIGRIQVGDMGRIGHQGRGQGNKWEVGSKAKTTAKLETWVKKHKAHIHTLIWDAISNPSFVLCHIFTWLLKRASLGKDRITLKSDLFLCQSTLSMRTKTRWASMVAMVGITASPAWRVPMGCKHFHPRNPHSATLLIRSTDT